MIESNSWVTLRSLDTIDYVFRYLCTPINLIDVNLFYLLRQGFSVIGVDFTSYWCTSMVQPIVSISCKDSNVFQRSLSRWGVIGSNLFLSSKNCWEIKKSLKVFTTTLSKYLGTKNFKSMTPVGGYFTLNEVYDSWILPRILKKLGYFKGNGTHINWWTFRGS